MNDVITAENLKGLIYPFELNSGGTFRFESGYDVIDSDVKMAVIIELGERPVLKDIGSKVSKILFSNFDENNISLITALKDIIRTAVNNNVKYAIIDSYEDIDIRKNVDEKKIKSILISIRYRVTINQEKRQVEILI